MQISDLKIVELNVENLFLPTDHFSSQEVELMSEEEWRKLRGGLFPLKSLEKTTQLASHLLKMNPHFLILSEVGGKSSLASFNKHFLHDQYEVFLLEGNSPRGIDLGYMVKKGLPFHYSLQSHRRYPLYVQLSDGQIEQRKFSRDVLELRVHDQAEGEGRGRKEKTPFMILLAVHLKSKIWSDVHDPQGRIQRTAEVNGLIDIYQRLLRKFGKRAAIVLGGDFNGHAALPYPDPEFSAIYERTNLQDALEVAGKTQDERINYFHFQPSGLVEKNQLNYLFLSPSLQGRVLADQTHIYHYEDPPFHPTTREERQNMPSDHLPVVLTLQF